MGPRLLPFFKFSTPATGAREDSSARTVRVRKECSRRSRAAAFQRYEEIARPACDKSTSDTNNNSTSPKKIRRSARRRRVTRLAANLPPGGFAGNGGGPATDSAAPG